MLRSRFAGALLLSLLCTLARAADPLPPIPRLFPPAGTHKPDEATAKKLRELAEELERDLKPFDPRGRREVPFDPTLFADVAIYPKAVRYALDYDEFYKPTDVADAEKLLEIGRARLKELRDGVKEPSWTKQRGLVVRGYISVIDDSVQPYGLRIPEDLDLSKKPPLYVWLHGRQEKTLDLQFITERAKSKGKFAADDAITVHPFGRYNNAFKFAGERDVLNVMFHVERLYKTDPAKRVLMGFSMGGAGCWHIGAHYPHLFCAMAPGAGFSESRRFLKIKDDALPPWYEQVLWKWYDAPEYTENLFMLPVIAYSGEKDGQKQAADVMEAEFAKRGKKLNHIIGPNMGHDYDKGSLEKIRAELKAITAKASEKREQMGIVRLFPEYFYLIMESGQRVYPTDKSSSLIDHPPIDGAFCEPFVFVMPTGKSKNPAIDAWVARESAYQIDRWRRTMRGDVKIVKDTDVTTGLETNNVLILWGDRDSNRMIKKLLDSSDSWRSITKAHIRENEIPVGIVKKEAPIGFTFDCSPLGGNMARTELQYVLNSGPTFRDEHDRNNANQIPKLPDWAVIDVTTPGDAKSPGKIVTAGFFDESWQYVDPAKQQAEFEARQKQQQ
jgi:dienelactone hydrolase